MARTGRTSHPGIQAVWLAQQINMISNGAVIAPWEIDHLPEEWIEIILGMSTDLPEMKKARDNVQKYFEKHRKDHPNYRK